MKITRLFIGCIIFLAGLAGAFVAQAEPQTYEVYGKVTFPDGNPAANLRMTWQRLNESKEYEAITDSEGNYRVSVQGHAGLNYAAFRGQQGDYLLRGTITIPEGQKEPSRKDLVFELATLVLGEVTDSATGLPIEGADVDLYVGCSGHSVTDAEGVFKVIALPREKVQLSIGKNGYVRKRTEISTVNTMVTAWRIQLKPGGTVRGKVCDQDGNPIVGIEVGLDEDGMYWRSARTNAVGEYEIANVDPDISTQIRVHDARLHMTESAKCDFPKGSKEATCDIKVNLAGKELRKVSGNVTDANGAPVQNALVRFGKGLYWLDTKETNTDAQGNYILSNMTAAKNVLFVQSDGYAPAFMSVAETGDQNINITLQKAHSAQVCIIDKQGKPLDGVNITVNATTAALGEDSALIGNNVYRSLYSSVTDINGKATLANLPATGVVIDTYKKDYIASSNTALRVDSKDNFITMIGSPIIAGTVIDAVTKAVLQSFTVQWGAPGSYSLVGDSSVAFNNTDGRFMIPCGDSRFVGQKKYMARVFASGYISEELSFDSTQSPEINYGNIFKLEKSHPQAGRIIDSAGNGLPDVQVTIVEDRAYQVCFSPSRISPSAHIQKFVTAADGSFTIDQIQEKRATIILEKQGRQQVVKQAVELTKPIELTYPTPALITIKATNMVEYKTSVSLTRYKNHTYTTLPPKDLPIDGNLVISDLDPSGYIVHVKNAKRTEMRKIDMKPGQNYTLDLDTPGPVRVFGTVTRNGAPVKNIQVGVCRGNNEYSAMSISDESGNYSVNIDKPGSQTLSYNQFSGEDSIFQFIGQGAVKAQLELGDNRVDIKMPTGSISGRVIDDATGKPVDGQKVVVYGEYNCANLYDQPYSAAQLGGLAIGAATTDKDGSFKIEALPSGRTIILLEGWHQRTQHMGKAFIFDEKAPVENVEIRLTEPGKVKVTILDQKTGKPTDPMWIKLTNEDGMVVFTDNRYREGTSVPAGKYVVWINPVTGPYLPTHTNVEVRPGQMTDITLKLPAVRQRIVFKATKGGRFEKLRWYDKTPNPPPGFEDPRETDEEYYAGRPWVGYTIKDAVTGQAVLLDSNGPEWGGKHDFDRNRQAVIPIKPGKYAIEAVLRDTEDYSPKSKENLWKKSTVITVQPGKDAVISID